MRTSVRLIVSAALTFASLSLLALANRLPQSRMRDSFTDAMAFPGGVIGWVLYPGGVHGTHPTGWAWACFIGNVAFYGLAWLLVLTLIERHRLTARANRREVKA